MQVPYLGHVLKLGSRGNPVYAVKRALLKAGYIDHIGPFPKLYGPRVAGAVGRFQIAKHLTSDGEVGKLTLAALSPYFDNYGYLLYTGHYPGLPELQLPKTFIPTHPTGGLPGFPAVDLFAPAGATVLAPERVELQWPHFINWNGTSHVGGWTCYLQGRDATYFATHFGTMMPRGTYARGEKIGTVGQVPNGMWPEHIHFGKHVGHYEPPQP